MIRPSMTVLLALAVGACASPQARDGDHAFAKADLESSSHVPPGSAHYDPTTGECSGDSVQLVSREEYESLVGGWKTPADCDDVARSRVPDSTGYPALFARLGKSGSAQVLVRLEGDGTVESARTVCASDSGFADAAEETAKSIRYQPAMCDGKAVRSAFLLPLSYAP